MIQSLAPRKAVHLSTKIFTYNQKKKSNQIQWSQLFSQENLLRKNTVRPQICFCYRNDSAILVCCNHPNSSINKHNHTQSYSRKVIKNTWVVKQRLSLWQTNIPSVAIFIRTKTPTPYYQKLLFPMNFKAVSCGKNNHLLCL